MRKYAIRDILGSMMRLLDYGLTIAAISINSVGLSHIHTSADGLSIPWQALFWFPRQTVALKARSDGANMQDVRE